MLKRISYFCLVMTVLATLTTCGPSPEAVATMTASAWTPTPKPTVTPTPLPYDLEVTLEGEGGESITYGVSVEATEHEDVIMDESGVVDLLNLPGPEVEVSINAQGYNPHTETVTLERGKNPVVFTLAADPMQVNPATACPEGSKILYIEDFEDGFTQDWEGGANRPTWNFDDVEGRGKVATFTGEVEGAFGTVITPEKQDYGNMVWKFDFKGGDTHFMMHGFEGDEAKYRIIFQPGREGIVIVHEENNESAASAQRGFNESEWTSAAITYFDGSVEIWMNNEFYLALDDPNPIMEGRLGFITAVEGAPFSIDNIVVCELTEPYAPPVVEEVEN